MVIDKTSFTDGRVQAGVECFGVAGEPLRGRFQASAHLLPMVRQRAKSLSARLRGETFIQRTRMAGESPDRVAAPWPPDGSCKCWEWVVNAASVSATVVATRWCNASVWLVRAAAVASAVVVKRR